MLDVSPTDASASFWTEFRPRSLFRHASHSAALPFSLFALPPTPPRYDGSMKLGHIFVRPAVFGIFSLRSPQNKLTMLRWHSSDSLVEAGRISQSHRAVQVDKLSSIVSNLHVLDGVSSVVMRKVTGVV